MLYLLAVAIVAGLTLYLLNRRRRFHGVSQTDTYLAPGTRHAVLQAQLEAQVERANSVINRYASLLENSSGFGHVRSTAELPAPTEEIKRSLVTMAGIRRRHGELTNAELEVYRVAYSQLARFVPPALAEPHQKVFEASKEWQKSETKSDAELVNILEKFSKAYGLEAEEVDVPGNMVRLAAEFDSRLAYAMEA